MTAHLLLNFWIWLCLEHVAVRLAIEETRMVHGVRQCVCGVRVWVCGCVRGQIEVTVGVAVAICERISKHTDHRNNKTVFTADARCTTALNSMDNGIESFKNIPSRSC